MPEYINGVQSGGSSTGSGISTDTSSFNNNLSAADDTVQKALDTLDDTAGGGGANLSYTTASGVVVSDSGSNATISVMSGDAGSGGTRGLVPDQATGDSSKYLKGDGTWDSPVGGGATNLSIGTTTATTVDVDSDTGTNATIPTATITVAGLLQATDKVKLDGIETGADVTDATNVNSAGAVMQTDYTVKGDILVATGAGATSGLPLGTDGQLLTVDSAQASGVKWATAPNSESTTVSDTASIDLTLTGSDISGVVLPAGVDHDSLNNYVANEHVDHSSVTISAGTGLTGGGSITASRSINLDVNSLTAETASANDDEIAMYDTSGTATRKITKNNLRAKQGQLIADADSTMVDVDDFITYTSLTASRTVNLPTASSVPTGAEYFIKDMSGNASIATPIVIDPSGVETIDGQTTLNIEVPYGVVRLFSTGSEWGTS